MSNYNDQNIHTFQSAPAAKVSYSLGDQQPVICSLIDSAQLFYTDHEEADSDKYGEPYPTASAEATVDKQTNAINKITSDFEYTTHEYVNLFQDARNSITGQGKSNDIAATLDTLKIILSDSGLAKAYLAEAEKYDVLLQYNSSVKTAIYDRAEGVIRINPNLAQDHQVLCTLQELRRHYQHRQGVLFNPLNFCPDNAILINRMQHADLISSTVRCAWELKLAGHKDIWKTVSNSSYADIARAFAREAHADFRTINNGFATTAAFEAWFLSERCRHVDRTIIRQMLADHAGYVFDLDHHQSSLQPSIIAALGEFPLGKNYLAKYTTTILNDPIFSEVRDRSNSNFLWFIKFERTFRETEHDLQNSFSSAVRAGHETNQGQSNEEKIVVLYDNHNQPNQQPIVACGGSKQSASIVNLWDVKNSRGA